MELFTTALDLYGGVLWSGELQGFIIQQMMPSSSTKCTSMSYELLLAIGWSIEWPKLGEPRNFLPI
jgi:hypothetical protein